MNSEHCSRRRFLQQSIALAAGGSLGLAVPGRGLFAADSPATKPAFRSAFSDAKVAIVSCRSYGVEVDDALVKCFDLLGGIGSLVKTDRKSVV